MARPVLLDTDTISFGDLFSGASTYHVPSFQRDYSWTEENWDDLWQDIELALKDPQYRHYMGAIVVQPDATTGGQYTVIDGQQRLATLSVLAIAVVRRIQNLADSQLDERRNSERVKLLSADFLGKKDAASLHYSSKLTLNETDDPLYQDYLRQFKDPKNERDYPKSSRGLLAAYRYFDERIQSNSKISRDGKALAAFLSKTLALQLLFIRISVQDQLNAYTVFETLNARGVELSATDLLKNYLFSLMRSKQDLARVKRRWAAVIDKVRYEHFPELLRYYLSLTRALVRKERLFKTTREVIRDAKAAFKLLDNLYGYAELFSALQDPNHDYWSDKKEARQYVRHLVIFRVRQLYPLIFAAADRFSDDDFRRTLKMLSAVSFRYNVVSSANTNYLERAYNQAANQVMSRKLTKPRGIFNLLRQADVYVSDRKFASDFAAFQWPTAGSGRKVTRYVLYAFENSIKSDSRDFEEDGGSIEHVLPENPTSAWSSVTASDGWEDYIYCIGNLSLLEKKINHQLGGKEFSVKRRAYRKSVYGLSRRIKVRHWTVATIEARAQLMAKKATEIWRVDFDAR